MLQYLGESNYTRNNDTVNAGSDILLSTMQSTLLLRLEVKWPFSVHRGTVLSVIGDQAGSLGVTGLVFTISRSGTRREAGVESPDLSQAWVLANDLALSRDATGADTGGKTSAKEGTVAEGSNPIMPRGRLLSCAWFKRRWPLLPK